MGLKKTFMLLLVLGLSLMLAACGGSERISVTADKELIDSDVIVPLLKKGKGSQARHLNQLNRIMPLKEATKKLEEELIGRAMAVYGTTSEAAKALGVSQSTVSSKYNDLIERRKRGERVGVEN
jgi:transcriptional regulator with PAS, ATPase and Fis domain